MRIGFGQIVLGLLGAMIPSPGVSMNDVKMRRLSRVVCRLAFNTADALIQINNELIAMSMMIMQKCLALDILLEKESRVCEVFKVREYCTFIPDNSRVINAYVLNITNVSCEVKSFEEYGLWEAVDY